MPTPEWRRANIEKVRQSRREWYDRNKDAEIKKAAVRRDKQRIETRQWLNDLKSSQGCSICGETHPACLEFHHEDRTQKEINIAQTLNAGWSKTRILKEIEKCTVLCSNCHRKLHAEEDAEAS